MESIFHEKQEGSLCAQHCLNALLQNQYFSAVDLAQIGRRLDEQERERMAEGGIATNEYQQFIEQPSSNYDDSGFFSIQVITEALSVWGLDMVVFNSQNPVAIQAREDPRQMSAFICNYLQHWFSVRKIGNQWFNLNSLLSGPELISDTYLSLFLTQLQQEGYSILIVVGSLPDCEADQVLRLIPAVQTVKPRLLTEKEGGTDASVDGEDNALKEALRASKEMIDNDDSSLQAALQLSMEGYIKEQSISSEKSYHQESSASRNPSWSSPSQSSSSSKPASLSQEELRLKRLAFLNKHSSHSDGISSEESSSNTNTEVLEDSVEQEPNEEDLLQQAIAMSMQQSS